MVLIQRNKRKTSLWKEKELRILYNVWSKTGRCYFSSAVLPTLHYAKLGPREYVFQTMLQLGSLLRRRRSGGQECKHTQENISTTRVEYI